MRVIIGSMGHLEAADLEATWTAFKNSGDMECRNQLVLHYTSLVRYVAAKVGGGLPAMVDRDDLISYGMFGLIDAIGKFSLDKGVKFETYGVARIKGAIYDEIRALDWVPRSIRSKARDVEKARAEIEMELGRPAEHSEIAATLGLDMEEYWTLASQATISYVESSNRGFFSAAAMEGNGGLETGTYDMHSDPTANPEDQFQASEIIDLLGEAVDNMDESSKTILFLYYLQGLTLAEIGRILGVTESRVCQLQSKVLLSLSDSLGRGGLVAA